MGLLGSRPENRVPFSNFCTITTQNMLTGLTTIPIDGKMAIVASCLDDPSIYAYGMDGQMLWRYAYQAPVNALSTATFKGKPVILAGIGSTTCALSEKGSLLWSHDTPRTQIAYPDNMLGRWAAKQAAAMPPPWGVVNTAGGTFKKTESALAITYYNGCNPVLLTHEGKHWFDIPSPFFKVSYCTEKNKEPCLVGVGGAFSYGSMYSGSQNIRIIYPDGNHYDFKAKGGSHGQQVQVTSRMKPTVAFTAGTVGNSPVAVFGKHLERYLLAYTLDGKELWRYDTKLGFGAEDWGMQDVAIGKIGNQDVVIAGAFSGMLSVLDASGAPLWAAPLSSNVLYVAYTNYNNTNIMIAGLFNGMILCFNEGHVPFVPPPSRPAAPTSYPCGTCGSAMRFVNEYQRWYCDKCRKYA